MNGWKGVCNVSYRHLKEIKIRVLKNCILWIVSSEKFMQAGGFREYC